jgi:hypothetical protein
VLAALELLKARAPQDIAALKGVDLIGVASLGQTGSGRTTGGAVSICGGRASAERA